MADPQVVYAHHKMDVPKDDIIDLFGDGKIGIDFDMDEAFDETAFREEGKSVTSVKTMNSLREDGGIVLGQYHRDDLMLLGYINQDKNVENIKAGDGTRIKALQLDRYEQVNHKDYPELFNVAKGQHAIANLNTDDDVVREVFKKVFDEDTLNSI